MSAKKRNLGRGLSAIFGEEGSAAVPGASTPAAGVQDVTIALLHPGRYQPRRTFMDGDVSELADSIRDVGVLQPLLVREHPEKPGEFEIIAGERRWRAAQKAQLHEVPVVIKALSHQEAAEIALIENLQREDLSPIEEAAGYKRLMVEFEHTQEALAKAVGKSRPHVANMLRLLTLPEAVRDLVEAKKLSAGHARALIGADDPAALAKRVVSEGLSVRQTERLVGGPEGGASGGAAKKRAPVAKDPDTAALETSLGETLGLKVQISDKAGKGTVTVHYRSLDQLDGLLHRLSHGDNSKG